jgi:ubiquinol-cytochrome c reductase cytochrome c subunit
MKRMTWAALAAIIFTAATLPFGARDAIGQTTTPAAAPVTPPGDAVRGKAAFLKYGCYECHGTAGQGNKFSGPTLAPHPIPFVALISYIRRPAGQMPSQSALIVPDAVVADIYAYLQSIPPAKPVNSIHALAGIPTAPVH